MITFTAKTVDEAVIRGLAELGITRENALIEVVENGSKGLFGIGARDAVVKVGRKGDAEADNVVEEILHTDENFDKAADFLRNVLGGMSVAGITLTRFRDKNGYTIKIDSEDAGVIIGKRGQTLNALQYLLNIYLNRGREEKVFYNLDIENYRNMREKSLQDLSVKLAQRVRERGKNVELEPMSSRERRIIHMTLKNNPHVTTFSKGDDPYRKVVISPRNRQTSRRQGYDQ
ncbi:MAG: protein jag [Candidatus Wallbacteria bacterium]|nr:protein jag [Candidatus Wallbacteria bacterium]